MKTKKTYNIDKQLKSDNIILFLINVSLIGTAIIGTKAREITFIFSQLFE